MSEVIYESCDPPEFIVTISPHDRPPDEWRDYYRYGFYRVVLDDGFTMVSPHQAEAGTVSMEPLDVEDDEIREFLIQEAERTREVLKARG